ncbi:MAG: molybdenum cofactor biosynthesis protein MoaE [Phycisphaerales bacterium]
MSVEVRMCAGPLKAGSTIEAPSEAGARVVFEGVVRGHEGDRSIVALNYQAYRPMADEMLRSIAAETLAQFGLLAIHVEHSDGTVKVGECSFRLVIHAPHRKPAIAAMDAFIDRMKRDVPIWKTAIWSA